jgi:hypothetical protein
MATTFNPCTDRVEHETAKIDAPVKFDAIGGRVVGVILALYGLAVVFEVVRSYILTS